MGNNNKPSELRQAAMRRLHERLAAGYAARRRRTDMRHYALATVLLATLAAALLLTSSTISANARPNDKARITHTVAVIDKIIKTE